MSYLYIYIFIFELNRSSSAQSIARRVDLAQDKDCICIISPFEHYLRAINGKNVLAQQHRQPAATFVLCCVELHTLHFNITLSAFVRRPIIHDVYNVRSCFHQAAGQSLALYTRDAPSRLGASDHFLYMCNSPIFARCWHNEEGLVYCC